MTFGCSRFVSEKVKTVAVGDEVIINPALRWIEKSDAPPINASSQRFFSGMRDAFFFA